MQKITQNWACLNVEEFGVSVIAACEHSLWVHSSQLIGETAVDLFVGERSESVRERAVEVPNRQRAIVVTVHQFSIAKVEHIVDVSLGRRHYFGSLQFVCLLIKYIFYLNDALFCPCSHNFSFIEVEILNCLNFLRKDEGPILILERVIKRLNDFVPGEMHDELFLVDDFEFEDIF